MSNITESRLPCDNGDPAEEQFPRQLLFEFVDDHTDVQNPSMSIYLRRATPNVFPDGPTQNYLGTGKPQGYRLGQLGDTLTDRSATDDGHRFHDATHMSLLYTTNFSPILRSLMGLNRRSRPNIDNTEDGPRTKIMEEALLNSFSLETQSAASDYEVRAAAFRLSHTAAQEFQHFLQPGTSIPAERWQEALQIGHFITAFLKVSIGQITAADRNPNVSFAEKLHSAWLYLDRDEPGIYLSGVSDEHALNGSGLEVQKHVKQYAASRAEYHALADRLTL